MKNKSKFIIIISIFVILIGLLSTFAYFTWKSTNNDISFTVSGVTVELNDGKDIIGANLMPTLKYTSTGNINKPIKIRLKEEYVHMFEMIYAHIFLYERYTRN